MIGGDAYGCVGMFPSEDMHVCMGVDMGLDSVVLLLIERQVLHG
jgi:hypothetical protein